MQRAQGQGAELLGERCIVPLYVSRRAGKRDNTHWGAVVCQREENEGRKRRSWLSRGICRQ
jgi:hypothetical protein